MKSMPFWRSLPTSVTSLDVNNVNCARFKDVMNAGITFSVPSKRLLLVLAVSAPSWRIGDVAVVAWAVTLGCAHFIAPMLLPLSGLLAGVKPRVKLLALAIPYSGNPKVRYDSVFSLGPFNINKSPFHCPYVVTPFGVAGRGKASREIACIGHSVLWEP